MNAANYKLDKGFVLGVHPTIVNVDVVPSVILAKAHTHCQWCIEYLDLKSKAVSSKRTNELTIKSIEQNGNNWMQGMSVTCKDSTHTLT